MEQDNTTPQETPMYVETLAVKVRHIRRVTTTPIRSKLDSNALQTQKRPFATLATAFLESSNLLFFSVAVCNDADNYDKRVGTSKALLRLESFVTKQTKRRGAEFSLDELSDVPVVSQRLYGVVENVTNPREVWFSVNREDRSQPVTVSISKRTFDNEDTVSEEV
jgi:hypothetical protein